jgi:translocation protein SEC63
MALAYGTTKAVLSAYHTSQNLIQATRPGASPLEQLPHFTPAVAEAAEAERSRNHLSIQEFMTIPASQRKARLVAPGLLSEDQFSTAMALASQIPVLHVEKAFFKVVGERFVTPSSLVQFVIKARFIPPGATNVPEINPKDLLDIDPDESDVAAISGRKDDRSDEKPIQPPLTHAPYYARDHAPRWYIFLADSKQGRIAVPPFTFTTFDKPILDASGKPTFNVQTLKMQFGAPPQPGSYTFVMHMICDSYIGMDTKQEVTLVVEDASKAEAVEEEEEISEPDEGKCKATHYRKDLTNISLDSFTGQMRTLKEGAPAKKKKKSRDDDSSDGSDTEGDVESESETDTDTDSEAE